VKTAMLPSGAHVEMVSQLLKSSVPVMCRNSLFIIDTAPIVCGRVDVTAYLSLVSICLSHPSTAAAACKKIVTGCCCGPGRHRTSINSSGCYMPLQHSIKQQMRAVSRRQLT